MAVALSLPILAGAAAEAPPLRLANFDFTSALVAGDLTIGNDTTEGFLFVPPAATARSFGWALEANRLIVNWTNLTRQEVGRPDDPSSTYFFTRINPAVQGEQQFGPSTVSSQSTKTDSNLLVLGAKQSPSNFSTKAPEVGTNHDHVTNRTWHAGPEVTPTVTDENWSPIRIAFALPNNTLQITAQGATTTVVGNLTLYVWQATIQVRSANASHAFVSGTSDQTLAPAGPNPGPLIRERVYRLLRLEAVDAQLTVQVDQGPAYLAAPALPITGNGLASFQGTNGLVTQGPKTYTLSEEPLKARGEFSIQFSKPSQARSLHADLELMQGEFDVVRPQELSAIPIPPTPPWWQTPAWFWGAGILTLVAVPVVIVRRNALVIDDVEWALLSGKYTRSARWAKILINRNPRDADVLFLYGTALLRLKDPQRMINKVEVLANKIPREKRTGIAYTLAVAAHEAGDAKRLRRWATEAAREPLLRAHLHKQGVWKESTKSGHSKFTQTGYA